MGGWIGDGVSLTTSETDAHALRIHVDLWKTRRGLNCGVERSNGRSIVWLDGPMVKCLEDRLVECSEARMVG